MPAPSIKSEEKKMLSGTAGVDCWENRGRGGAILGFRLLREKNMFEVVVAGTTGTSTSSTTYR
jgi:hypothetical protein